MSKRRFRAEETAEPEALTPEERRSKHRRERAHRKAGSDAAARSPWRRAAVIGIPAAVIAVVVLILVVSHLPTPCLTFQPIPTMSGVPAFPDHNGSDFSRSWCPSASQVYGVTPKLTIYINGAAVTLPSAIGRNNSYPGSYACNLPILTEPAAPPQYPQGSFRIISAWNYRYNLSTFFSVWSESYHGIAIDQAHPSQPILYQSNDLLGFTSNATKTISLYVDNQPSSAGPLLDLTTLDFASTPADPYPTCLATVYGTGHTIVLAYHNASSQTPFEFGSVGVVDATGLADPQAPLRLADGPLPHFGFLTPTIQGVEKMQHASLAWLAFRGVAG
ncbi:MAG: hypothetical protein L3J93_02675 [Thermoplasmata archaeon]|nr:hypothetical protein [Thermoplasmata archaeon]